MRRRHVSGLPGIVALVLGIAISTLAPTPAEAVVTPVSRTLAEGVGMGAKPDKDVRRLQRILRAQGRSLGPAGVDGRFGPATEAAVRGFQRSYGLPADGIVGPKTRKVLRLACRAGECGRTRPAATNRPARDATAGAPDRAPASDDSGSVSNVVPTAAVLLAMILAAFTFRRWRASREAKAEAPSARPFPASRPAPKPERHVIGYLGTVEYASTTEQEEAQEAAIAQECERRNWQLVDVLREVPGGGREALAYALDVIDAGDATGMVVAEAESVAGSAAALGRVLARLQKAGGCFVAMDAGVDTTTREGAMAAAMLVALTEKERKRLDTEVRGLFPRYSAARGADMN